MPTSIGAWLGHSRRDSGSGVWGTRDTSKIDAALVSVGGSDDKAPASSDSDFDGWLDVISNDLAELLAGR